MNPAVSRLFSSARAVVAVQALIGSIVALAYLLLQGGWGAQSALYGGMISIASALLLSAGVASAGRAAERSTRRGVAILTIAAAQRFLLVLVMFGFGLYALKLAPLATIVGFAATQLAYVIESRRRWSASDL